MPLIAKDVVKSYGGTPVLAGVSLTVNSGDHLAVVGSNGAGKSTLLRVLSGLDEPDEGTVFRDQGEIVGYLPQTTPTFEGSTLADLIAESAGELRRAESRLRELESAMSSPVRTQQDVDRVLVEYGRLQAEFEARGGYEIESRIDAVLGGLELNYLPKDQPVATLSGGETARVALAGLLIKDPDILLLDEPTNHLDMRATAWLEGYLASRRRAVIAVSHDRVFLNRFATSIIELDEHTHRATVYGGNYDAFVAAKAVERRSWEEAYARQQEEIRELRLAARTGGGRVGHYRAARDRDKYAHHARGERVQAATSNRVRSAAERLRRIQAAPIPRPPDPLRIDARFHTKTSRAEKAIVAERVYKNFDGRRVLDGVNLTVSGRSRQVIVGPNGAGKTTLLRILAGVDQPTEGSIRVARDVRVGYLSQTPTFNDPTEQVLHAYRDGLTGAEDEIVAGIVRYGLLRLEDLDRSIGQLSVGQQRKLEIARMIAMRPNVLLLDEPTNFLSLDVLAGLEEALADFAGPVVAVSHDRWFVQRIRGTILKLDRGQLAEVDGGMDLLSINAEG